MESHIKHVDQIIAFLEQTGVTSKVKKGNVFKSEVEYLGHIIRTGFLAVDRANTESHRKVRPPTSKTELKSFMGICDVYRLVIKRFTEKAYQRSQVLKKTSPDEFKLDER